MDELILENIPEEDEAQEFCLATVGAVSAEGVTLIFDGQTEASGKTYKVNTTVPFAAGDRVRIKKDSGTYIVEFVVGAPFADYPIPTGGTTGQVLAKSSNSNYAVQWIEAPQGLPAGGTTGQVLAKSSNSNYAVQWVSAPQGVPTGGTTGQILSKSSNSDYAVQWTDAPHGIPAGGSSGQVLMKSSNNDYSVQWGAPSAGKLVSGSYNVELSGTTLTPSANTIALGSSSKPFGALYAQGAVYLGNSYGGSVHICAASGSTLGFFGHTAASRQTVASTATVATLITALKAYGLIN